jgi:hypothetical protein
MAFSFRSFEEKRRLFLFLSFVVLGGGESGGNLTTSDVYPLRGRKTMVLLEKASYSWIAKT